jgi:hypothetical protein
MSLLVDFDNFINKKKNSEDFILKANVKEHDKRCLRENMIKGIETMDSSGFIWHEWNGLFYDLTGRKPTDEEFVDYCDWIDKQKKQINEPLYDELKVWFDKRNIDMLPKIRQNDKNNQNM